MTPAELDMLAYGVKVYIYRRPLDSKVYASVLNYERFNVLPLEIVRVPVTETTTVENVIEHASVKAALARHSR